MLKGSTIRDDYGAVRRADEGRKRSNEEQVDLPRVKLSVRKTFAALYR
jgi:hypothetical protein